MLAQLTEYLRTGNMNSAADRGGESVAKPADKGITPFHWEIEFPEVFGAARMRGFDCIVGNPPFAGKNTIIEATYADGYLDWLKTIHPESHGNATWWPISSAARSTCCGTAAPLA